MVVTVEPRLEQMLAAVVVELPGIVVPAVQVHRPAEQAEQPQLVAAAAVDSRCWGPVFPAYTAGVVEALDCMAQAPMAQVVSVET